MIKKKNHCDQVEVYVNFKKYFNLQLKNCTRFNNSFLYLSGYVKVGKSYLLTQNQGQG